MTEKLIPYDLTLRHPVPSGWLRRPARIWRAPEDPFPYVDPADAVIAKEYDASGEWSRTQFAMILYGPINGLFFSIAAGICRPLRLYPQ